MTAHGALQISAFSGQVGGLVAATGTNSGYRNPFGNASLAECYRGFGHNEG